MTHRAKDIAVTEEHKRKYYEEIPHVTPRIQAAMDSVNEEFGKGQVCGKYKLIGSQVFLQEDGRLYWRAQRLDRVKRKTEWVSIHALRCSMKKGKN